jgi:drug/metabolite transporter (DMT)-like permease
MSLTYGLPPGALNCPGYTWQGREIKYRVTFWMPVLFVIILLISVSLWIVYEHEHKKKWWELFVSFLFAILYFCLFATFYMNCNWFAALALTFIPVTVIALQLGKIDASIVNPLGLGFNVMIENDYKPYWVDN